MTQPHTANPKLDAWATKVITQCMPVFSDTAQKLIEAADDPDSPVALLSSIILEDAAMTARVLQLANSAFYNPGRQSLSTISRAVTVLGVNKIKGICLTVALVNSLLKSIPRERLAREMARAFHAAVQARSFAIARNQSSPEEVFIAALLFRVGEMAFWCFGEEETVQLDSALRSLNLSESEAEEKVLGFRLSQLSLLLARKWRLGELVQDALCGAAGDEASPWPLIVFAHEITRIIEEGWDKTRMTLMLKRTAELLDVSEEKAFSLLKENTAEAASVARKFGATIIIPFLPLSKRAESLMSSDDRVLFLESDSLLQLQILREISLLPETGGTSINQVLEMIVEGIYRGIGMDRAVFATISPDRTKLAGKFVLGLDRAELLSRFDFPLSQFDTDIFSYSIKTNRPFWIKNDTPREVKRLVTDQIVTAVGNGPFFIYPAVIKGIAVGVFYADRRLSERPLDHDQFACFRHFGKQAIMALEHIAA